MNNAIKRHKQILKTIPPILQYVIQGNAHPCKVQPALRFDMTKEEIQKTPMNFFQGKIYIISDESDEENLNIRYILSKIENSEIVGFDTETAVFFTHEARKNPISLVQLALEDEVLLWRLRRNKEYVNKSFPSKLQNILRDSNIRKVGTGNERDLTDLYSFYHVTVSNMVDNQVVAKKLGFTKVGLMSLAAQLFGWSVSKRRQVSNWEAPKLDREQILYAATDAWASLLVYKGLKSIFKTLEATQPRPVPSVFETTLKKETQHDTRLFRSLNSKVFAPDDLIPRRTVRSLLRLKHERLEKRKGQKANIGTDDIDLDCLCDHYKKWTQNGLAVSDFYNVKKDILNSNDLIQFLDSGNSREMPFVYQCLFGKTEESIPT